MATARDFHYTTDAAGEAADSRAEAITAVAAELAQDDAEVTSAYGSLDSDDYDGLDALLARAYRERDGAVFTERLFALIEGQLRSKAERLVDDRRGAQRVRSAEAFADMLQRPRAGVAA